MQLPHRPSLDGLRALAVLAVLAYHGGVVATPGGFLGVDVFFVLSGYLITALLVLEHHHAGRIDLRRFWGRRLRRLVPALVLVVATVLGHGALVAPDTLAALRGDALAALGYVANWRFALGDHSYFAALESVSPLRHTWSLGIEEQWYLVWPVALVALLSVTRRKTGWMVAVVAGAAAASGLLAAVLYAPSRDPLRVYYGTDTRVQALLVGAALGLLLHRQGKLPAFRPRAALALDAIAAAGLAALAWMVVTLDGADPRLYRGGLGMAALASAALVAAASHPASPVIGRALAIAPLRALGRISYGVYLWHWPLFLWIDADTARVDGLALLAIEVAVTVLVAAASFRWIEQPIRDGRLPRLARRPWLAPAGAVAVAAAVVAATLGVATTDAPVRAAAETPRLAPPAERAAVTAPVAPGPTPSGSRIPAQGETPRVLVVGDSVGLTLAVDAPSGLTVEVNGEGTYLGCGIVHGRPYNGGRAILWEDPACREWRGRWGEAASRFEPHVTVVVLGAWEVLDHEIDGRRYRVGTDEYGDLIGAALLDGIDLLTRHGSAVVLLTQACNDPAPADPLNDTSDRGDDARVAWFNGLLAHATLARPSTRLVDLHGFACPGGRYATTIDGADIRTDGVHYSPEGAARIWDWLVPHLHDVLDSPGADIPAKPPKT